MEDCSSKLKIWYFVFDTVLTYSEKIVIKKIFCEFEVEGRKLIPKTNLFKQERSELFMKQSIIIFYNCNRVQRQASTYFLFTAAVHA